MKLTFIERKEELKPYIQSLWVFESPLGMPPSESNLAAPNGCPKLIVPYENSITSIADGRTQESDEQGVYFVGNRDSSTLLSTSARRTGFIGIEFHPHGAYPIFGVPMGETTNRLLTADVSFGKWGEKVSEILRNEPTVERKVDHLQRYLADSLRRRRLQNPLINFCVGALKRTNGLISIRELELKTGYSRRYLEILFKNHVGLPPKALAGIFRFQKFYQKWAAGVPFEKVREELYDYYYDQSHFTKVFKKMTSFSPEHFTREVSNEFGRRLLLH
jgi:AraC-like DNA-binding protein